MAHVSSGNVATPLSEKSEEYKRVLYLLQMCTKNYALSDVCVWQFGSAAQAVRFEKRTRGMASLPAWTSTRRLSEENNLESLYHKGFVLPSSKEGLTFSSGDLDIDLNEGTAQRFLLCQLGVGRAFVVDDPSEQTSLPEGYDSLYLALSTSIDEGLDGTGTANYRHEYTVMDAEQVLPMFLVQFFVDPDGRNSEGDFAEGYRNGELRDTSPDGVYDRCDWFDPILYTPVSVRDKMVGSHSSGELAQHKLIGINDAYEAAVAESMRVDPIVASRQEEIKSQLRAVDAKLRQVNANSAEVEEKIYRTLQEALFRLQDLTQSKMSALLSEEVELRRQLQYIEHMESHLDIVRETASQVDFLNSWKCHVQLRGDAVRDHLRTPGVLSRISTDLDLVGGVKVISRSVVEQQNLEKQQQDFQAQHSRSHAREQHHHHQPLQELRTDRKSQQSNVSAGSVDLNQSQDLSGMSRVSHNEAASLSKSSTAGGASTRDMPSPAPLQDHGQSGEQDRYVSTSASTPVEQAVPQNSGEQVLRQLLASSEVNTSPEVPTSHEKRYDSLELSALPEIDREALASPPAEPLSLSIMSNLTPAKFAQFSMKAEAVRRLRQLHVSNEESLKIAERAFEESKILNHPNIEREMTRMRQAEEDRRAREEEERANRGRGVALPPVPPQIPRVMCDAESLLLGIPGVSSFSRKGFDLPATKLLYATWKSGTERSVAALVNSMPKEYLEYDESDEEDDKPDNDRPEFRLLPVRTVMVIKSGNKIFGGYADEPWRPDGQTFGGPNCFLFSASLDIKIPFHGRKVFDPPPYVPEYEGSDDEFSDYESTGPRFASLKSDQEVLHFGVNDLVLSGDLKSCTSELEWTFGVGLKQGSEEAQTLLAGTHHFVIDELELWEIEDLR